MLELLLLPVLACLIVFAESCKSMRSAQLERLQWQPVPPYGCLEWWSGFRRWFVVSWLIVRDCLCQPGYLLLTGLRGGVGWACLLLTCTSVGVQEVPDILYCGRGGVLRGCLAACRRRGRGLLRAATAVAAGRSCCCSKADSDVRGIVLRVGWAAVCHCSSLPGREARSSRVIKALPRQQAPAVAHV